MKKRASISVLHVLLHPLDGEASHTREEWDEIAKIGTVDNAETIKLLHKYLYEGGSPTAQRFTEAVKVSLQYYLSQNDFPFERFFDMSDYCFDFQGTAREFLILVWNALFPGEAYKVTDLADYQPE